MTDTEPQGHKVSGSLLDSRLSWHPRHDHCHTPGTCRECRPPSSPTPAAHEAEPDHAVALPPAERAAIRERLTWVANAMTADSWWPDHYGEDVSRLLAENDEIARMLTGARTGVETWIDEYETRSHPMTEQKALLVEIDAFLARRRGDA